MIYGQTPFNDSANMKMYEKIITQPLSFPNKPQSIHDDCKQIMVSLLKKDQSQRLGEGPGGIEHVKQHAWFAVKLD